MKKKILLLVMLLSMMSIFAGCGKKGNEKIVSGVFMDKKDFMFTVQDAGGVYWGFNFDEKPDNYEEFENGDQVKVIYTGNLSEVDPFDGEIISIEKK